MKSAKSIATYSTHNPFRVTGRVSLRACSPCVLGELALSKSKIYQTTPNIILLHHGFEICPNPGPCPRVHHPLLSSSPSIVSLQASPPFVISRHRCPSRHCHSIDQVQGTTSRDSILPSSVIALGGLTCLQSRVLRVLRVFTCVPLTLKAFCRVFLAFRPTRPPFSPCRPLPTPRLIPPPHIHPLRVSSGPTTPSPTFLRRKTCSDQWSPRPRPLYPLHLTMMRR